MIYFFVIAGAVVDLVLTGIILTHVFSNSVSERLKPLHLGLFRVSQIIECGLVVLIFFLVRPDWSLFFLVIICVGIWSRAFSQMSVLVFHRSMRHWSQAVILTTIRKVFRLDEKGFTLLEALASDTVWMLAVGLMLWLM